MSKVVYLCLRDNKKKFDYEKSLLNLFKRLSPNNITPNTPLIYNNNGLISGVFNPVEGLAVKNSSICIGHLIESESDWWKPKAKIPDGSYALFRGNENTIELATDIVASRTIWYIQTEDIFIASTSQRAIVFFLGDFKPNRTVFPWMLSCGTLGPGLSWDERIGSLNGNTRLILDRASWKVNIKEEELNFDNLALSYEEHEKEMKNALIDVLADPKLDYSKWCLPLSGGFDSRTILLMLKNRKGLKCVTWGVKASMNDKENDAYIAGSLAKHFNLEHKFFQTDISDEPIEEIFNRFLVAGEGRVDHIPGYADGFKIWKTLFKNKITGIIRGDHSSGDPLRNFLTFNPRRHSAARILSDYFSLSNFYKFGLERQIWPERLKRKKKESRFTWYIRLYQQFHIPYILAALNDLKCTYVEIFTPLLTKRVVEQVRKLPDSLRINKKLQKKIVYSLSPKINFAKHTALSTPQSILKTQRVVNHIISGLDTDYARNLLSSGVIDYIIEHIEICDKNVKPKRSVKYRINKCIFTILKNTFRNSILSSLAKEFIDINTVAFRAYLICKMHKMLNEDAKSLHIQKL